MTTMMSDDLAVERGRAEAIAADLHTARESALVALMSITDGEQESLLTPTQALAHAEMVLALRRVRDAVDQFRAAIPDRFDP